MTTSGNCVDTHGQAGQKLNLAHSQFVGSGRILKTLTDHRLVLDRFRQSLLREAHVTSQWKQTLTVIGKMGRALPSNMFAGRRGADTLRTFNKQVSKYQLKSMSERLLLKFMLQLHKLPTCPERTCGE